MLVFLFVLGRQVMYASDIHPRLGGESSEHFRPPLPPFLPLSRLRNSSLNELSWKETLAGLACRDNKHYSIIWVCDKYQCESDKPSLHSKVLQCVPGCEKSTGRLAPEAHIWENKKKHVAPKAAFRRQVWLDIFWITHTLAEGSQTLLTAEQSLTDFHFEKFKFCSLFL